jgi:chaperone modulatory protein CbpM
MSPTDPHAMPAEILEERVVFSLADLSRLCAVEVQQIEALLEEGVITTLSVSATERHFDGHALRRTRIAVRLQRDLGINLPGVALALDLLEELERLRRAHP